MTEPRYAARRATVEDLPQLVALWRLEQLPTDALEKRFTEFQVVCDESGQVRAAVGLQIVGAQGCLHSEAIAEPELSGTFRALLWNRLQILIQNHALERLWTQLHAAFWREHGFEMASAEVLSLRPAAFPSQEPEWLVQTLRAANAAAALDREFAELKAFQAEEKNRSQERLRWMKRLALGVTIFVFALIVVLALVMLKFGPRLFPR